MAAVAGDAWRIARSNAVNDQLPMPVATSGVMLVL